MNGLERTENISSKNLLKCWSIAGTSALGLREIISKMKVKVIVKKFILFGKTLEPPD